MVPEKELHLGRLAVEQGMLTREELSGCIEARQESGRPLSLILIERGFLDDQGVLSLIECESKFRQTELVAAGPPRSPGPGGETEDILFANLAVSLGHVSLAELESCLAERGAFERRGQSMTLGQMLVKRKALPVSVFLDLSQKLEEQTLECFQCRHLESGRGRSPGQAFRCSQCGAELRIPKMEELLQHLAATTPPSRATGDGGRGTDRSNSEPRPPSPGRGGSSPPSDMASTLPEPARPLPVAGESTGSAAPLQEGRAIAGYRIIGEIARGGMGVVYKAEQTNLARTVALKIIRADRQSSDTRIQRFHREAQAIGRLSHPGIVQIYEVGEAEGCHFIAMEYLEGRPLDAILRDALPAPREATRILRDLARAVAYAHSQGVLHRDLKPSNVIVDSTGRPRLTDFGLAKLVGKDEMQLTHSDDVVGTPYYVPPELIQHGSRAFSERGDVYALGVIYYQLLTGRLPYRGKNSVEVYHSILHQTPVAPRRVVPAVRRTMEAVCLQAFARDAGERYAGAGELADELDRILAGEPVTSAILPAARPRRKDRARLARRVLVVVGAVALLAAGWFAGRWFVGRGPGGSAKGGEAAGRTETPDPSPAPP
ncbi:MAG: serine/threonine protein kinase, partial [Planctomycetes bacterium]|nr:serine/threonine protein kinase [Planctomycetota bacterium]